MSGMTRDELIDELKKCPYNSEVEFRIDAAGCETYVKVDSSDRFSAIKIQSLPKITIIIE